MATAQDLDSMTPADLVPRTQKEAAVTVFSLSGRIAKVEKAVEEAYPGIVLIGIDLSSAKQIARIKAEHQARVHAVDVLYLADAPVVLRDLLTPGLVHTYVPPRVAGQLDERFKAPLLVHRLSTKEIGRASCRERVCQYV